MSKHNNNHPHDSTSIIGEIESKLEEILSKKKESIEKELEEKIKREQEEAQKKIEAIESELKEEKEVLGSYRITFVEYEKRKTEIKKEIKDHLSKAIDLQGKIETMTAQTMEELKVVSELNHELEKIHAEALEQTGSLKKTLEEKYGIVADVPESNGHEDVGIDLQRELVKLKKIKELLETNEGIIEEKVELKESTEKSSLELDEEGILKESKPVDQEEISLKAQQEQHPVEGGVEDKSPEDYSEKVETEKEENNISLEEEKLYKGEEKSFSEEVEESKPESGFEDIQKELESYKKSESIEGNGELVYYENQGNVIIDAEFFVSKMNECVEEAKKFYVKLSQVESPREQFFVKQDIIRFQEILRKLVLNYVELCEKQSCQLPGYTEEIINPDVLKDILERVTLGNWSNQEDFASFDMHVRQLSNNFNKKLNPPKEYLESVLSQLKS